MRTLCKSLTYNNNFMNKRQYCQRMQLERILIRGKLNEKLVFSCFVNRRFCFNFRKFYLNNLNGEWYCIWLLSRLCIIETVLEWNP